MSLSMRCRIHSAVLAWVVGLLGAGSVQAGTIYVSTVGNDANDGLTWPTAKKTVQAGLNVAAVPGNQVWVAAGTYVETITLKAGVALYGGFAGNETDLGQRSWTGNPTILDGNRAGSVVTAPSGATASTRIDGFTIRNGSGTFLTNDRYGGGIYCASSSPTIANNTITGNSASSTYGKGGGIYCGSGSPTITGNTVATNSADYGGGIHCGSGSSTIAGNTIADNSAAYNGGGIYCSHSSFTIANNTVAGNSAGYGGGIYCNACSAGLMIANNTIMSNSVYLNGGGIYCYASSPTIVSTIIAFNSCGIASEGAGTPSLRCNCVYGNDRSNYLGLADPTGTNGNISADPRLVGLACRDAHIQPDSPCVDAGDDSVVLAGWPDMDGQVRKLGSRVDIGADESDGTRWPPPPYATVRVSTEGNDAQDGSSWAQAKRTVQAAIDAAAASGGDVWVKEGTYQERITLRNYTHVYGGFAGTETQRSARNWSKHVTILDGHQAGGVVTANDILRGASSLDGFTVRNGNGNLWSFWRYGGGVYCYNASPRIANNTFTGNTAASGGGGIYCKYSSPAIANNIISANSASYGSGIYCSSSSPAITNNTITGNSASEGGGICCESSSSPTIANNTIITNSVTSYGGGIYCGYSSSPAVANNTITGNIAGSYGGGISCLSSSVTIINNTIMGNSASYGGGIYCNYSPTIANTIIAFNSSGMYGSGTPAMRYNCVYGNTAYNYSGLTDPTGTGGNRSVDPRFVRLASSGPDGTWGTTDDDCGDLRLRPGSACIDSGSNADVPADAADLDDDGNATEPLPFDLAGAIRFADDPATAETGSGTPPLVDIGAYEYLCGDVDGDSHVNVIDLLTLAGSWGLTAGQSGFSPACDLNSDAAVNTVDLLYLANNWGR